MQQRIHHQRGFALLEMFIVIVILAILGALAYDRFVRVDEAADARDFVEDIRELSIGCRNSRINNSYAGLSTTSFINNSNAPTHLIDAAGTGLVHSFGGTITIRPATLGGVANSGCEIDMAAVPAAACSRAVLRTANQFHTIIVGTTTVKSDTVTINQGTVGARCAAGGVRVRLRAQ